MALRLERVPIFCQSSLGREQGAGPVDLQEISDRMEIEGVLIRYTRAHAGERAAAEARRLDLGAI